MADTRRRTAIGRSNTLMPHCLACHITATVRCKQVLACIRNIVQMR